MVENGVVCDLVCMSKPPLHAAPLLVFTAPRRTGTERAIAPMRAAQLAASSTATAAASGRNGSVSYMMFRYMSCESATHNLTRSP